MCLISDIRDLPIIWVSEFHDPLEGVWGVYTYTSPYKRQWLVCQSSEHKTKDRNIIDTGLGPLIQLHNV